MWEEATWPAPWGARLVRLGIVTQYYSMNRFIEMLAAARAGRFLCKMAESPG